MVDPQAVDVRVVFPRGFEVGELPEGWRVDRDGVAIYATDDLETTESFEVEAMPPATPAG